MPKDFRAVAKKVLDTGIKEYSMYLFEECIFIIIKPCIIK